jgi:ribosomal protein S18 acetylase RimI-like enzyme
MDSAPTWTTRSAVEADLPFLLSLRQATMAPHFARQGIALSDEEQRQRAEYRLDAAGILVVDGAPVGLMKVLRDGDDWTLEQFQVAPSHQGRGLGTRVLRALIADARESGAGLRLSVLKQNPAARLYERLGFRTLGESTDAVKMILVDSEASGHES